MSDRGTVFCRAFRDPAKEIACVCNAVMIWLVSLSSAMRCVLDLSYGRNREWNGFVKHGLRFVECVQEKMYDKISCKIFICLSKICFLLIGLVLVARATYFDLLLDSNRRSG